MKKYIRGVFVIVLAIVMIVGTNVYAATPTLEQIVDTFNNCKTVKEYATMGAVWTASCSDNKINISAVANKTTTNYEYTLENSILTANFEGTDEILGGCVITMVLADSIGQLHGYDDGDLFATFNSEEVSSYTLESHGFELKQLSEESCEIKIDISKKIPLIDTSNMYIEVGDLENLKQYISGDGFAEKSKGDVYLNKSGYDGENTLLIAEKGDLTQNTYKSILSVLEVMFESEKACDYFKPNFSDISVGNKEFTGFKIEVNPSKTEFEEKLIPDDRGYKFIRITIDKNLAMEAIKVDTNSNNNQSNEELPKAGIEFNYATALNIILVFACMSLVLIVLTSVFKKKENN